MTGGVPAPLQIEEVSISLAILKVYTFSKKRGEDLPRIPCSSARIRLDSTLRQSNPYHAHDRAVDIRNHVVKTKHFPPDVDEFHHISLI